MFLLLSAVFLVCDWGSTSKKIHVFKKKKQFRCDSSPTSQTTWTRTVCGGEGAELIVWFDGTI